MKIPALVLVTGILCAAPPILAAGLDARLEWSRRVDLAMPVSGVVASVPVNAGDRVARGQLLLALDAVPFNAAVAEAEARRATRQIERDEARRDARQAQELYDRTVLSTVELENAKNRQARAEAHYREAGAALDRARYHLRISRLQAPFDARVLSRRAEVGQTIAAELSPPVLLVIAAAGEYLAQARLGAERAAALGSGQAVQVQVAGKSYPGQVRAVAYDTAGGKEPYLLEAAFSTTDVLHAGQAARIVLP